MFATVGVEHTHTHSLIESYGGYQRYTNTNKCNLNSILG